MADSNNQKLNVNSNYRLVPTNADGSINVKLSDEQLNKIIPKNEDGSINVRTPLGASMDVNLNGICGVKPDWTNNNEFYDGTSKHARLTVSSK
jgi:hypothetical protein